MFYSKLFSLSASGTVPKYSTVVIESEYFKHIDADEIKVTIQELASKADNLIIYTESVPVTARWMRIKAREYKWRRLPGSDETNDIDEAIKEVLSNMQEEFISAVYYPSLTNFDNTHEVIRRLDGINTNILYAGYSSLIVDYCIMTRKSDDYMINTESKIREYISLAEIRDAKLSKWPSPGTFVLMSHLIRDDFGHKIQENLSARDLMLTPVSHDLLDNGNLLEEEEYARVLTISMVELMQDAEAVLTGIAESVGVESSLTYFTTSILAEAIRKFDPSFIPKQNRIQAQKAVSFLYLKLQYVASYLLDEEVDYTWTADPTINEVFLKNVKQIYRALIIEERGFSSMVEPLRRNRQKIRYQNMPINLYRTELVYGVTPIRDTQFWNMLYNSDGEVNISYYESKDAPVIPRDALIEIARLNLPERVIKEHTEEESIYSSMTVKPKTKRKEPTENVYITTLRRTKFSLNERRR